MKAERLLELYERVADAPKAVEKLRRFVLDLAVRGKLVAQGPHDEPTAASLERIASIRDATTTTKRASRKRDLDHGLRSLPFDIPQHWDAAPLSDLVRVINGRAYKKNELLEAGTPVLRVGNLFTSNKWYYSDLKLDEDKYCDEGDLIYAWSASFGPFIWKGPRTIYHYHIWKLNFFSEQDLAKPFLYLVLEQRTREIKAQGHGISMVHMTKEKMEALAVPYPPIDEQYRIVAKVEELMALLDRLEETRKAREATRDRLTAAGLSRLTAAPSAEDGADQTAGGDAEAPAAAFRANAQFALDALPSLTARPDQIKLLRQTIFDLAVRGKLVEQDPADEPAAALLGSIVEEEKRLVALGEIKPRKFRPPTASGDCSFDLPSGWAWCRQGDLTLFSDAGWSPRTENRAREGDAWGVLKVSAVSWDVFQPNENKELPQGVEPRIQAQVHAGDFLISRANTATLVARAVIVQDEARNLLMSDKIVRLRFSDLFNKRVAWLINNYSSSARNYYATRATGVSPSMKNVSRETILELPFALPPRAEQDRIMTKVDELMDLCDEIERALERSNQTRAELLDTVLREVIAGSGTANEKGGQKVAEHMHRARSAVA